MNISVFDAAIRATMSGPTPTVTREWIESHLAGSDRGAKKALAEAMGLNQNKLSNILSGARQVKASEAAGALRFFGYEFTGPATDAGDAAPGFSEPAAQAFEPKRGTDLDVVLTLASKRLVHPSYFRLNRGAPELDLQPQDILIIDAKAALTVGDLAICNLSDRYGNTATRICRWADPWLIGDGQVINRNSDNPTVGMIGPVKGVIRGTWLNATD